MLLSHPYKVINYQTRTSIYVAASQKEFSTGRVSWPLRVDGSDQDTFKAIACIVPLGFFPSFNVFFFEKLTLN